MNAPGESPGAIFRSMAGKLIVSFDFVDEKGNLIVKAPPFQHDDNSCNTGECICE